MNKTTTHVYTNASVVTALSVAERGLGFLYRIVLSRLIGAEGLGLYQVSLSLFSLFLTIGTGGIPLTVSRMITKSKAESSLNGEKEAVGAGLALCLLLTVPVSLILGIFGKSFGFLFSDERSLNVFRILLLGLSVTSVYAVLRGYFWGNKQFLLSSLLEIAEESVMVIAGVLLLQNVSNAGTGAEKAAWAVVLSYLFSFTASLLCFFFQGGKIGNPRKSLKPLFNATLPLTSVRASGSLINSAVAVLLPVMLIRTGIDETEALKLFGIVSGMVMPILFIPSTVIGSISLVLVPELSEDFYRKNFTRLNKNLERGLRCSILVACVLLPFFYALGEDAGRIAFSNVTAGEMIRKSSPLLLPMSLTMISTSMLNAMGFEKQTFLFYFISAAAMLLCILFLPPVCGIYAYVIGLGVSYTLNSVCNFVLLNKKSTLFRKGRGQVFVRSLFPALFAILPISLLGQFSNLLFKRIFGESLSAFFTAVCMGIVTLLIYILTGTIPVKSIFEKYLSKNRKKQPRNY